MQQGLGPLTVGLMLSGGVVLTRSADHAPLAFGLTIVTIVSVLRSSVHPLLLMAGGAVIGLAGLI